MIFLDGSAAIQFILQEKKQLILQQFKESLLFFTHCFQLVIKKRISVVHTIQQKYRLSILC
jgi:hypothetical protein